MFKASLLTMLFIGFSVIGYSGGFVEEGKSKCKFSAEYCK